MINVEELYKEQRMEKTIYVLERVIVFLIVLLVLLCIVNHYYEFCISNIRIRDFIFILFCICIAMKLKSLIKLVVHIDCLAIKPQMEVFYGRFLKKHTNDYL